MSIWLLAAITYAIGFGAGVLHSAELSLLVLVPIVFGPIIAYVRGVRRYEDRWFEELPAVEAEGAGAYRAGPVVPGHVRRIPLRVRLVSASCFFFGIQFVPGLALGLFGLIAAGAGILSIPGLYVAHEIWRAGRSVLQSTPYSIEQATRAARTATMLNLILSALFMFGVIGAVANGEPGLIVLAFLLLAMALGALAQARWLARVAAELRPRGYEVG